MKRNTRILAAVLMLVLVLTSSIFSIIAFATDTAPVLPEVTVNVPQGEVTVFEQDYEDTSNNTILSQSYYASLDTVYKGMPAIADGDTDYEGGKYADIDYRKVDWNSSVSTIVGYPAGVIYTGAASRSSQADYVPSAKDGYKLTFNFCNVTGFGEEFLYFCIYSAKLSENDSSSARGFKVQTSEFEAGIWYKVTVTNNNGTWTSTKTALTGDAAGTTSSLKIVANAAISGSRYNQFCYSFLPVTSGDKSAERKAAHFKIDAIKLTTEAFPSTSTTLTVLEQDYENTASNKTWAQAWISSSADKLLKDKDGNLLPYFVEGTDGWGDGLVADLDFSKLDWSTTSKVYSMGWLYPKGINSSHTVTHNRVEYIPSLEDGYTFSFDFHCIKGYDKDYLWVNIYDATGLGGAKRGFKIDTAQFDDGTWYHIEIKNSTAGAVATKTVLNGIGKGTTTALAYVGSTASTGTAASPTHRVNMVGITFYPHTGNNGDTSDARKQSHYQIDNLSLTTEKMNVITSTLGTAIDENAVPMLVAYDTKGIVTAVSKGTITDASTGSAEYDITSQYREFLNAKTVKVIYVDNMTNLNPLAVSLDIGDRIYEGATASELRTDTVEVTADMLPSGTSDNYTIMAYAVPNTTTAANIPTYNEGTHTLLALDQSTGAFTSFTYNKALYDYNKQDIAVVISNGINTVTSLIDGFIPPDITNIVLQLGADQTQLNFTWYSLNEATGEILYAKAKDMLDGEMPDDCMRATAERTASKKANYYANKATITGLEENTDYYYVLVNGTDKTEPKLISVGSFDSSFSFAFSGDPQVGRGYGNDTSIMWDCIEEDAKSWGLTLQQMMNSEQFSGIEFMMSAGDQINTHLSSYEGHELQWDAYSNHEELLSLPTVTVLGNHDADAYSIYPFHVNEPNVLLKPDGKPYGATTRYNGSTITGADYYFTYNKVLFMVLNTNNFVATDDSEAATAVDKAAADEHAAFITRVMEETKNMEINWTIVLYHQSPYGTSYHNNDSYKSGTDDYYRNEQYAYINIRRFLVPVLYENGVDIIFSGHDHCYTRSHVLKPDTDAEGNYLATSTVSPYADGTYVYEDGSTTPTFVKWTDTYGNVYDEAKVASKPIKVYNPDGIVHITGATGSGSQVNPASYENLYTAVKGTANTRHLSRVDITENSIKIVTYNMGTNTTEEITLFDTFEIIRTTEEEQAAASITSANLSLADDIAVRYFVTPNEELDTSKLAMRFTMNGKSVTVTEFTTDNGRLIFTFKGVAPQSMGDNIAAELLYDGEVIAEKAEYSIKQYATNMLSKSPTEELKTLLIDLLNYGAASQVYTSYKTDELVNAGVTETGSTAVPEEADDVRVATPSLDDTRKIVTMGVRFDYVNNLYIVFEAPDADGITIKVNGTEVEFKPYSTGKYIAYSDGIAPLLFADEYIIDLCYLDTEIQTVKYSVNSYAFAMKDGGDAMSELAIALYRYGISAKQYAN